jgi:hypothetical protein
MYTIKNLRTMQGHDGEAFSATLYRDGTKVAVITQEGHGGMTDVDFIVGENRAARDQHAGQFAAWVRANCAGHWIAQYVDAEHGDGPVSLGAEMLVEREQERRTLARHAKTKVLFRLPTDLDDGSVRTLPHRGQPAQAVTLIRAKYPHATIYDPQTGAWAS